MYIGIDFDGTCVTHEYPKVGRDIGAVEVLKELIKNKHQLILWTMRSGKELKDAENWFKDNGLELFGSNCNPTQFEWTESPKAYCHLYIDDAALGCPLMHSLDERPYVNWSTVRLLLKEQGIIND